MVTLLQRCCVLSILSLLTSVCPPAVSQQTHRPPVSANPVFAREMMQSMAKMDREMMTAPMTGDHDFAAMMIPHHQGAVDMAKAILLHGKDPVLRRLAQEIIVTQRQEIDVMRLRLTARTACRPCAASASTPTLRTAGLLHLENTPRREEQKAVPATAVSSRDRVYTADQTSNTVSVIDPAANTLLGVIRLGDPVPGALSPLYRGQLLVHGMGFSPDHKTLAVVSVGSNSVTFIDTATNGIKGVVYIGRSPHEAFFTPDGRELWATVRGEDYVSVIDPLKRREIRRIQTANGPGMVPFRPDGRYAFVPSSFTPEVDVVDTKTYNVVARVPQASPFSPNLAVSQDGQEGLVYAQRQRQDAGDARDAALRHSGHAGYRPHHQSCGARRERQRQVCLCDGGSGERREGLPSRRNTRTGRCHSDRRPAARHLAVRRRDPSYVGLENQDAVAAIDTLSNTVLATIPVGQQPQALVYVPQAVPDGNAASPLMALGEAGQVAHLTLTSTGGSAHAGRATVSVNALGPLTCCR